MKMLNMIHLSLCTFVFYFSFTSATDCISNRHKVLDCFKKNGVELSMWTNQDDVLSWFFEITAVDINIQCLKMNDFANGYECARMKMDLCLSLAGMTGIQPNADNMAMGYQSLCQKQNNFDANCFKDQFPKIITCGQLVLKAQLEGKELTLSRIICLFNDAIYDCAEYILKICSKNTTLLYLEQLSDPLLPSECINKRPNRSNRVKYEALMSSTAAHHAVTCLLVFFVNVFCSISWT